MTDAASDLSLFLATPEGTARLAVWLADIAGPRDTLLLEGPIGAGKTHFARAFIKERTGAGQDVPSPTFTLVQTYESDQGEIWHADLYRLSRPDDILELGLDAAFGHALCLVEWPDRLGAQAPSDALRLIFGAEDEGRRVWLSGGQAWMERLGRHAGRWHG
jgi:tRNA threonylcarbamoyladenosine biosynthesis protein TsaE